MPLAVGGAILLGAAGAASAHKNKNSGGKKIPGPAGAPSSKKSKQTLKAGFETPEFSGFFTGDKKNPTFNLTRSANQQGLLDGLRSRLGDATSAFRSLRDQVVPGFGDLTQARVRAIRDAGSRTVGNLREELGRRRVAGSSFAEREIGALESQFARQEAEVRAESKIQEIALTDQLIQQEFDVAFQTLTTLVDQGNFEATLAANVQAGAQTLQQQTANANNQISQANQGGMMELIGTAISAYAVFAS